MYISPVYVYIHLYMIYIYIYTYIYIYLLRIYIYICIYIVATGIFHSIIWLSFQQLLIAAPINDTFDEALGHSAPKPCSTEILTAKARILDAARSHEYIIYYTVYTATNNKKVSF